MRRPPMPTLPSSLVRVPCPWQLCGSAPQSVMSLSQVSFPIRKLQSDLRHSKLWEAFQANLRDELGMS